MDVRIQVAPRPAWKQRAGVSVQLLATEAYERLEFLSVLVEAHEDKHDPIDDSEA